MKYTAILFLFFCQLVSAQNLSRIPYLQNIGHQEITVRWMTDIAANTAIQYSEASNTLGQKMITSSSSTDHIVILKDLKPNTKYIYRILINDRVVASGNDFYFKTAPIVGSKNPVNLWIIGDFGDVGSRYLANQRKVMDQYLKQKNEHTDLWLWLGDNTYANQYQAGVFNEYGTKIMSNTPFMPVLGNHDYQNNPALRQSTNLPYHQLVSVPTQGERGGVASNTKSYYAYDYANIHFVALDSYGADAAGRRLSDLQSEQYQWLQKDLLANTQPWTVVYYHHPVYTKRSHNSDAEPELQLLREALVPVFDQFKVDLVLSGHSHLYERSYFIKGHTEHSAYFNVDKYAVQKSSGRYDGSPNSCPFIKKNEGVIYATIGSSGRLDNLEGALAPAHPTSYYSNLQIGGSMLMTIEDNRLDARWITADGETKDQFTILKEVNKKINLSADYGDKININASWKGSYNWSNNTKTKEITVKTLKTEVFIVKDSLGCLADTINVVASPQPEAIIETAETTICDEQDLNFKAIFKDIKPNKFSFDLELSTDGGSFEKPLVLQKNIIGNVGKIKLPTSLQDGNYQIRLKPNVDYFKIQPSKSIKFSHQSTGKISGEQTVFKDSTVVFEINLTGTPPWKYQVSGFELVVSNTSNNIFKFKAKENKVFKLEKVENVCGLGQTSGFANLTIKQPLNVTNLESEIIISPNPVLDLLTIQTSNNSQKSIKVTNSSGNVVLEQTFSELKKHLDFESIQSGIYFLEIKTESTKKVFRIVKR